MFLLCLNSWNEEYHSQWVHDVVYVPGHLSVKGGGGGATWKITQSKDNNKSQ